MPEQRTQRGEQVLEADINQPVSTPIYPFGNGGLDLNSAIDMVKVGEFTRLSNAYYTIGAGRELTGRPGQTALATAGTTHHSIVRVDDPLTNDFTRMWGVDTSVMRGQSGALTPVDAGYSGHPLTLLPHRPPLSGEPWVFVGDSTRNRKIRSDGLVTEIGLPAPSVAASAALGPNQRTNIAQMRDTATDGTGAPGWTRNGGWDFSTPPQLTGPPDFGVFNIVSGLNLFKTHPLPAIVAAGSGFYQFWGLAVTRDLSKVGSRDATDDDLIHLKIQLGFPAKTAEVRVYFVVSTPFTPSTLPGTLALSPNDDYYVKSFRPADFAQFIAGTQAQVSAAETARINFLREQSLNKSNPIFHPQQPLGGGPFPTDNSALKSLEAGGSASEIVEFGIVSYPLRRGDFQRYGNAAGRDWSTVTGIIIYIQQTPGIFAGPTNSDVSIGEMDLRGGYGPDSVEATSSKYDYRYTHYDPRTGAEGNPSPIEADIAFLDSARQQILVTPTAFGDGAVRQRFYRRGGTLPDDWRFEGVNASDGGVFTDELSDLEVAAADVVSIDNYQAVPTVDADGNTILAQPVPVYFGPVNGQLYALGDPYRPGFVYACAPGEPDHWPPNLAHEVCAPSESLMNGVIYGGQPFVFSRARGYTLYPNISGDAGMTSAPSGCTRGLAGRWAITVGAGAIWFVANDGVFRTTGGVEELVSADIMPLFQGVTKNGYFPVDLAIEPALRLAIYRNELYFQYQDTDGSRQTMVLQILSGQWRHYRFGQQNATLYAEEIGDEARLLIGGVVSGASYTHDGYSDAGGPINGLVRTAAWDFGRPREEKLLTDQILDCNRAGVTIYLTNRLNNGGVVNPTETLGEGTGRVRAIFDAFGIQPQHARNIDTEITWAAPVDAPPPTLYLMGISHALQPDLTINRVTQWDDLGHPDEKYVTGITLDCDTGTRTRTIHIERDFAGSISDIAVIQVTANGRHKLIFSWPALPANMVRIRPDDECIAWLLYRADWIALPEPPRIAGWDIHFENAWDQYYTGLDFECDTFGQDKSVTVEADGVVVTTLTINANGRKVIQKAIPQALGRVWRFFPIDANPGRLYSKRPVFDEEPFQLDRWETQETDHDLGGFQSIIDAQVTLKSSAPVTLTMLTVINQATGAAVTDIYTILSTGGQKRMVFVPFVARNGMLFKYLFTSVAPFWLYQEESHVTIQPFNGGEPVARRPWGNSDSDRTRNMINTTIAAQVSGGGT